MALFLIQPTGGKPVGYLQAWPRILARFARKLQPPPPAPRASHSHRSLSNAEIESTYCRVHFRLEKTTEGGGKFSPNVFLEIGLKLSFF